MTNKVIIKKRYVNSKRLFVEINDFIEEGLAQPSLTWDVPIHRQSFVEVVIDWLAEFHAEGRITQYDVIGDERVNLSNEPQELYNIIIKYKQKHCLNTTIIQYQVLENDDDGMDDLLDWVLQP